MQVDQAEDQHAAWNRSGARLRVLPRQPHHRLGRPSRLQVCPIAARLLGGACQVHSQLVPLPRCRWDMMVFFMCHCLAWFIADYIQLTGVQVRSVPAHTGVREAWLSSDSLMTSLVGRPPEFLQAGLRRGLVHPRVDGRADLPVGAVGPHHQLEDRPVPAALRRHGRGDPGRVAAGGGARRSAPPAGAGWFLFVRRTKGVTACMSLCFLLFIFPLVL